MSKSCKVLARWSNEDLGETPKGSNAWVWHLEKCSGCGVSLSGWEDFKNWLSGGSQNYRVSREKCELCVLSWNVLRVSGGLDMLVQHIFRAWGVGCNFVAGAVVPRMSFCRWKNWRLPLGGTNWWRTWNVRGIRPLSFIVGGWVPFAGLLRQSMHCGLGCELRRSSVSALRTWRVRWVMTASNNLLRRSSKQAGSSKASGSIFLGLMPTAILMTVRISGVCWSRNCALCLICDVGLTVSDGKHVEEEGGFVLHEPVFCKSWDCRKTAFAEWSQAAPHVAATCARCYARVRKEKEVIGGMVTTNIVTTSWVTQRTLQARVSLGASVGEIQQAFETVMGTWAWSGNVVLADHWLRLSGDLMTLAPDRDSTSSTVLQGFNSSSLGALLLHESLVLHMVRRQKRLVNELRMKVASTPWKRGILICVWMTSNWLERNKTLIRCGNYSTKKSIWENQHLSWIMCTWAALKDNAK